MARFASVGAVEYENILKGMNNQLHDKTFIGLGNGGYRFIQSR